MHLQVWDEVVDTVVAVEGNEVVFQKVGRVIINDGRVRQALKQCVGKKIAVLRTDIHGKEYLLREVKT